MIDPNAIVGIVLAGGQSRRMGGPDKALTPLGGQPMVARAIAKLARQVPAIALNSNRPATTFSTLMDCPVFGDTIEGFKGPLAGVLSAMAFAKAHHHNATHIVTAATDTPFFPDDLVIRLAGAISETNQIAIANSGGNRHPVFGLWPLALKDHLAHWLNQSDTMKVMAWVKLQSHIDVDFEIKQGRDPFFNVNTPEDLAQAAQLVLEGATT